MTIQPSKAGLAEIEKTKGTPQLVGPTVQRITYLKVVLLCIGVSSHKFSDLRSSALSNLSVEVHNIAVGVRDHIMSLVIQFEECRSSAHKRFHIGLEAVGDEISKERYLATLPAGEPEQRAQATADFLFFVSFFLLPLSDLDLCALLLVLLSKLSLFLFARIVGSKGTGLSKNRTMSSGVGGVAGFLPFLRVAQRNNRSASVGFKRLRGRAGDPG